MECEQDNFEKLSTWHESVSPRCSNKKLFETMLTQSFVDPDHKPQKCTRAKSSRNKCENE